MEIELLRTVAAALEVADIPYMVTGSVVSAIYGEPRATRDLDFVIDPRPGDIEVFVAELSPERFYWDDASTAVRLRDMFNIIDLASGWKADLIIRKDRPFSREELARRQPVNISGVETYIATPEDAILSKIEWHSMSGSERQRRDVLEMLVVNFDSLDREYLDRWAAELDVASLLVELWTEADAER